MAKSTFGSSFAQTFQQSLAAARKAEDEEKADKRFNERLAEQRAYNTREDTKKEFFKLGGTAEEEATYSGAENQYAFNLRMDELRAENKAGREASRTGKPLYAPDTETGTGEGTINPTAGFRRGFEAQQTATDEIKFNAGTQAKIAAEARAIINQERDDERLDKAIAFGASRPEVPFDFNQPIDKVEQDQAEAARMEAHNIDRMKAGLPPLPVSERLYTSGMQPEGTGTARRLMGPSIAQPTEGSFKDVFNAEQLRTLGTVRGQAEASTSGQIIGRNNQAASRALFDKNLPKEYQALLDEPDFINKYGASMSQYYENQALGKAGEIKNAKALDLFLVERNYKDSDEIIRGAESLGIKPVVDEKGLATSDFKSAFLAGYEKVNVREKITDPDTQEDTYFSTQKWQKRGGGNKSKSPTPMNLNPADANKTQGGKKFWPLPERK